MNFTAKSWLHESLKRLIKGSNQAIIWGFLLSYIFPALFRAWCIGFDILSEFILVTFDSLTENLPQIEHTKALIEHGIQVLNLCCDVKIVFLAIQLLIGAELAVLFLNIVIHKALDMLADALIPL